MASKSHWDWLVRLTHWLVAALVVFNQLNEEGEQWHRWAGYAVAGLVLVRLVWGLVLAPVDSPARLRQWWPTVDGVIGHLRQLTQTRAEPHAGHNPLGALMVLALWSVLLALGATGWMMGLDAFWGDEWLEDAHEALGKSLFVLVPLHVAGAVFESWRTRTNLVAGMIRPHQTGSKQGRTS